MQMTHLNQPSRTPVLTHSQPITNRYKYITDKLPSALQPIVIYLLSIPFVGLSVRILHCIWRVFAFIVRAGKVQLRLEACNLIDVCREVVVEQRFLTGRTIELEAPPTPIMLQADNDRLEQVVINLVSNALKYSPESNPVKVLIDQHRDIGSIEVYDSGPGIPKNEHS